MLVKMNARPAPPSVLGQREPNAAHRGDTSVTPITKHLPGHDVLGSDVYKVLGHELKTTTKYEGVTKRVY